MVGTVARLNAEQQQTPAHTATGSSSPSLSSGKGTGQDKQGGSNTTTGQPPSSIAQAGVCRADGGEREEWRV